MSFQNKTIIFYDGYCVLCNRSVLWVLNRDKKNIFYFASLQSDVVKKVLLQSYSEFLEKDSVILYHQGNYYSNSAAVQKVLFLLNYPYKFFAKIMQTIPDSWNDKLYSIIAKNRYQWFGKYKACKLLPLKYNDRILH